MLQGGVSSRMQQDKQLRTFVYAVLVSRSDHKLLVATGVFFNGIDSNNITISFSLPFRSYVRTVCKFVFYGVVRTAVFVDQVLMYTRFLFAGFVFFCLFAVIRRASC